MSPMTFPVPAPLPATRVAFRTYTPEQIAEASRCPLEHVRMYWPKLTEQLRHAGIYEYEVTLGLIGTVAIESASQFKAVEEAFWLNEADRWAEYVRRGYDGGPEYHGRGGIQHTHKFNYEKLGPKIATLWATSPQQPAMDLVTNPNNLLDQDMSSAADVLYFRDTQTLEGYSIVDACRERDWEWVRRLVYGGKDPAGEARISSIVNQLEGTDPRMVTYNPFEPTHLQEEDFDCAQESLEWALFALGRTPADGWLESTMIAEGVLSPALGLLDASGKGLADFVNRHYGEFGFLANNEPAVSFTFVALEGDHAYPLLIGGRGWNHWSGVRGYDASRDLLLLANPSPGYQGVGDTMNQEQFRRLGPFSMVRVWHPDLLGGAPEIIPPLPEPPLPEQPDPPDPPDPPILLPPRTKAVVLQEIRDRLDELARLP